LCTGTSGTRVGLPSRQCRLRIAGGLIAHSRAMASRGRSLRLFHLNQLWLRSCWFGGMLMPLHPCESNRQAIPFGLMVSTRTLRSLAVTGLLSRFTTNVGGLLTSGSDGPGVAGCFPLLGLVIGDSTRGVLDWGFSQPTFYLHYHSMRWWLRHHPSWDGAFQRSHWERL